MALDGSRTTKADIELWFGHLCNDLGKRVATSYDDVGAWRLDYVACYGGWNIEEICTESGGIRHPFDSRRYAGRAMFDYIDALRQGANFVKAGL